MKVGRPHGLDGSFYVDAPLEEGETVTIGEREFTVAARKGTDARPIVRLEGIEDRDAAEALRGEELGSADVEPLDEGGWPIADLIGCEIEGVGVVSAVLEGISCDVLDVEGELIPLVTDAVTKVDVENKVIEVDREFLGL
ncbi:MAG: ribosome maturation factor RimM [Thermoleophilaceae bacterium]